MTNSMKMKIFRDITQVIGCATVLYFIGDFIYFIITNYWHTVVLSYLSVTEFLVALYFIKHIGKIVRKQFAELNRH